MPAITSLDLTNAKLDVDHIAAIATSLNPTATDRLGNTKKTMLGAVATILAFTDRGAWVTGTSYAVKDLVSVSGTWYVAVVAHVAGATFAGDQASKWRVYQGVIAGDLSANSGSSTIGFIQSGLGATSTTVEDVLRDIFNIDRWGGDPTGVADSSQAFLDCIAAGASTITLSGGNYKLLSPVDISNVNLVGAGQDKTTITAGVAMAYMFKMLGRIRVRDLYLQGAGLANNCLQLWGANGSEVSHARIEGAKYDNVVYLALSNNNSATIRNCLIRTCGTTYVTGTAAGTNGGSTVTISGAGDLTVFVRVGKDMWKSPSDVAGYAREITSVTATTIGVYPPLGNTFSGVGYSILQGSNIMVERHSDNNRISVKNCTLQSAKVASIYDQGLYGVISRDNVIEGNEYAHIIGQRGLAGVTYASHIDNMYCENSISYDILYAYSAGNAIVVGGVGQFGTDGSAFSKMEFPAIAAPTIIASTPQSYNFSYGVAFPSVQVPTTGANVLDDYEEGVWTPSDGSGVALAFTSVSGKYTKIGNLITATCKLTYPTTVTANTAFIAGLPFAQAGTVNYGGFVTANDSTVDLMISGYSASTVQPKSTIGATVPNSSLSAKTIAFTFIYYSN